MIGSRSDGSKAVGKTLGGRNVEIASIDTVVNGVVTIRNYGRRSWPTAKRGKPVKQGFSVENEIYEIRRSVNPPTLVKRDGVWYVQIHDGPLTIEAPIGAWFVSQVFELIVLPKVKE